MLQGAGAPKTSFDLLKNHSTKDQVLTNSLSKELTFHNTLKSVLRTKDINTKLLVGLEMFLGVGVMSWNSSKLQMTGVRHIYRPPRLGAVAPTASRNQPSIG